MQLVAGLYRQLGYATEVSGRPGDGGINIIGRHAANGETKTILIQCIHTPEITLDEPLIRRLLDLWQSHRQAKAAILVTSASVTPAAQDLATRQRIVLLDYTTLQRALNAAVQPSYAQDGKP